MNREELLRSARNLYENPGTNEALKVVLEETYPELKESEDERIRKELLEVIKHCYEDGGYALCTDDYKKYSAYLERQKELAVIPDELVKNYKLFCEQGGRELALLINAINGFNKLKEQQPAEWSDSVAKEMFIKALERAVEQTKKGYELTDCDKHSWWEDFKAYSGIKPAEWSEKDKECRDELIQYIEQRIGDDTTGQSLWEKWHSWIKSLPERFNLQSKQEWSDKDEDMLKSIIATCQLAAQDRDSGPAWKLCEMQERFLKSLHPQPHWKPSEEQMDALEHFIRSWGESGTMSPQNTILCAAKSLYTDLKNYFSLCPLL